LVLITLQLISLCGKKARPIFRFLTEPLYKTLRHEIGVFNPPERPEKLSHIFIIRETGYPKVGIKKALTINGADRDTVPAVSDSTHQVIGGLGADEKIDLIDIQTPRKNTAAGVCPETVCLQKLIDNFSMPTFVPLLSQPANFFDALFAIGHGFVTIFKLAVANPYRGDLRAGPFVHISAAFYQFVMAKRDDAAPAAFYPTFELLIC
jgi:hypothetical protein